MAWVPNPAPPPSPPPWVASPDRPLYDGFSTGLRAAATCATRRARTSLKTSWNHAPRIAQGLIKLARQGHHGRGDGRIDRLLRHLGHRRHLQGLWPVDAGQGRPHRNLDERVSPDLYRPDPANRAPVRPAADLGAGARARLRPPGAEPDAGRSRTR